MRCILCNELLTDHDIQQAESADVLRDHVACLVCLGEAESVPTRDGGTLSLDFNTEQGYAEPIMRSEEA